MYGFSAIIAVGILYSYRTSPFMKGKQYLLYGLGCLFIMGLGLRAGLISLLEDSSVDRVVRRPSGLRRAGRRPT